MTLTEWLDMHDTSQKVFSDQVGIGRSTLNRIIKGAEVPTSDEIRAIFLATQGKVTVDDWANMYDEIEDWIDVVVACQSS
jgi:Helix-turn-helix.